LFVLPVAAELVPGAVLEFRGDEGLELTPLEDSAVAL
jgi:hypothetical protein